MHDPNPQRAQEVFAQEDDRYRETQRSRRRPVIGVVLPADGAIPPALTELFGDRARILSVGLGLPRMDEASYDAAVSRIGQAATRLSDGGADAIALMGSSLSFYRGSVFNDQLRRTIEQASRRPAATMSDAVVAALHGHGARRLAVATAYTDDVSRRLVAFLRESGFEVESLESLGLRTIAEVRAVRPEELVALGQRAFVTAPRADALLISCGGLRTLGPGRLLQLQLRVPVISSAVAGARTAAALVGLH